LKDTRFREALNTNFSEFFGRESHLAADWSRYTESGATLARSTTSPVMITLRAGPLSPLRRRNNRSVVARTMASTGWVTGVSGDGLVVVPHHAHVPGDGDTGFHDIHHEGQGHVVVDDAQPGGPLLQLQKMPRHRGATGFVGRILKEPFGVNGRIEFRHGAAET